MTGEYRIGDTVSTDDGRVCKIVGATILYSLDDGSMWNEKRLTIVQRTYSDEMIFDELCKALCTTKKIVQQQNRKREGVLKRQAITYILRKRFGWTYSRIGKILKKDHTTSIYSIHVVEDMLEIKDDIFKDMIEQLDAAVKHINASRKDE